MDLVALVGLSDSPFDGVTMTRERRAERELLGAEVGAGRSILDAVAALPGFKGPLEKMYSGQLERKFVSRIRRYTYILMGTGKSGPGDNRVTLVALTTSKVESSSGEDAVDAVSAGWDCSLVF